MAPTVQGNATRIHNTCPIPNQFALKFNRQRYEFTTMIDVELLNKHNMHACRVHKPQMKGKLSGFTIHYNQNAIWHPKYLHKIPTIIYQEP